MNFKYKSNLRSTLSSNIRYWIKKINSSNYSGIAPYKFENTSTLFYVSNKSYIEKQILNYSNHCGYLLEIIKYFIKPNKIFLDVGANIGSISLPLANVFQKTNFHLFEPDKYIYKKLTANISLNSLENVKTNKIALSSKSETKSFYSTSNNNFNKGTSSLLRNCDVKNYEVTNIFCTTIDEYLINKNISPENICFLKLDVQGLEYEVLKGGLDLFSKKQIPILLEYEKKYDDFNFNIKLNIEKFLKDNNYSLFKIDKFNPGCMEYKKGLFNSEGNFICLPKE